MKRTLIQDNPLRFRTGFVSYGPLHDKYAFNPVFWGPVAAGFLYRPASDLISS